MIYKWTNKQKGGFEEMDMGDFLHKYEGGSGDKYHANVMPMLCQYHGNVMSEFECLRLQFAICFGCNDK